MASNTLESVARIVGGRREAPPSAVFGFAAPIEAGKTTLSSVVAERLNLPRVSFGGYLRKVARERGIPVTREALQELGQAMVDADVREFCAAVLREQPWRPGVPLVVDGVRHVQVLDTLRQLLEPAPEYLIYIEVDRVTQSERLRVDELPHEKPLEELERHLTEIQVREALPDRADLILDGTRPMEELVEKVIAFVRQPPQKGALSWEQKNARRIELIKLELQRPLRPHEVAELDQLQTGYFEYLDAKHPRAPFDRARLDELEARLRSANLVIPDEILQSTHMSEAERAQEIAVLLFQKEKLTMGQASRLAGLDRFRFQQLLASRRIPVHYDVAEFEKDLKTLEELGPP